MPKYVFELSATLPAGRELNARQLTLLEAALANGLQRVMPGAHIETAEPFEVLAGPPPGHCIDAPESRTHHEAQERITRRSASASPF